MVLNRVKVDFSMRHIQLKSDYFSVWYLVARITALTSAKLVSAKLVARVDQGCNQIISAEDSFFSFCVVILLYRNRDRCFMDSSVYFLW